MSLTSSLRPELPTTAANESVFGRDVFCGPSIRTGRYASGLRLVAQNLFHRFITPRGLLRGGEDELDYGLDLSGLVGSGHSAALVASLPGQIRSEAMKDPRIIDASAIVTATFEGPEVTYTIVIEAFTSEGPFELHIGVSSVTTELLKLVA